MKHKPIAQQVIVVLGASSGIGRATALLASQRGAQVVACGRDRKALHSLVAQAPGEVAIEEVDVADDERVREVAESTRTRFGRIDTWGHVAGVGAYGRFEDITPDEWRRMVDVTMLGPVWGARAALPHLRESGGAYVVVSSELAKRSFPLASSYAAAKHGVNGFVESLRVEMAKESPAVSVTQILPAAVATPFFENARTHLGVRPSGPPPVYKPETIAEAILHAAEHGGRDVPVGSAAKLQLGLQRLSPTLMDVFSRATAFRLQRSKDPKQPGDDALFDAPSGDDRLHGVVSNTHR